MDLCLVAKKHFSAEGKLGMTRGDFHHNGIMFICTDRMLTAAIDRVEVKSYVADSHFTCSNNNNNASSAENVSNFNKDYSRNLK